MSRTGRTIAVCTLAAGAIVLGAMRAGAYVERMYSLQEVLNESTNICRGVIESVDTNKKQIIADIQHDVKGNNPYKKIQINVHTSLPQFIPYMMAKVKPGQDILVFYKQEGQAIACLCYMDQFWLQLYGQALSDHTQMWWRMSHVEIRMNRTWNRSLNELHNTIAAVLAGTQQAPPPDPNVPPFDANVELAKLAVGQGPAGAATAKLFGRYVTLAHGQGDARGATWVDYDGDGDLDAYFCSSAGNHLYRSDAGGMFFNVTEKAGLSGGSHSAAWADYNGDGRPDLLLSTPKLFTNAGDTFRDDTALLPPLPQRDGEVCSWIDHNGDGWPDILIPNGEQGIIVWANTGHDSERFKDASTSAGLGGQGPGRAKGHFVSVADYDGDGFSDFLYNAGDGMLFHNTGDGKFEEVKESWIKFATTDVHKIGVAWGDYDNDGDPDLFVPQNNVGKLFRNNNDGTFADVTASAGELAQVIGEWTTAAWGDVDRDGRIDLYVGKGNGDARLFLNKGDGTFTNVVEAVGLYHVPGNARVFGAALGDFDADGDLDILANSIDGCCTIFLNDYAQKDPKRVYLAVRPKRTKGVVGATVRLFDEQDRLIGLRELGVAQNAGSQSDSVAFFGLPGGKYKVSICMSDGGFGQKEIEVGDGGLAVEIPVEEN